MGHDQSEKNKAIVREAFDTLFNKRTTQQPSDSGLRTTSSTVHTSRPGAMGCSGSSSRCQPSLPMSLS